MPSEELKHIFPNLGDSSREITSAATPKYNCIAWAAGDTSRWWWPFPKFFAYWPPSAARQETLEAFVAAYVTLGYGPCKDDKLEEGFEKVAIYLDALDKPTHAARQLPDGFWTSKCGRLEDVRHELHGLEGSAYGVVGQFMKRKRPL